MYSVNWSTKVITIPKADTTLVQSGPPEIRSLDVTDLWVALRDIEDNEVGINYLTIVKNTAPITVAGITLARVVEIINGYTLTFEDGLWAVNIIGGNSNVADAVNKNMVSVNTSNSAGFVSVTSGSGLSAEQAAQLRELHYLQGLDASRPLRVQATSRRVPADGSDIDQTITEVNGVVTVQRQ